MKKLLRYDPMSGTNKEISTKLENCIYIPILQCYNLAVNEFIKGDDYTEISFEDNITLKGLDSILSDIEKLSINTEQDIQSFQDLIVIYLEKVQRITKMNPEILFCFLSGDMKSMAQVIEQDYPNLGDFIAVYQKLGLNKQYTPKYKLK